MSRSLKKTIHTDEKDNPGLEKAGARSMPNLTPRCGGQGRVVMKRRRFGSTEKILRRNAPLFRRMFAKLGRRLDDQAIKEELEVEGEPEDHNR